MEKLNSSIEKNWILSNNQLALLVKELYFWMKKSKWTDEEIIKKLWRRTVKEIDASRDTCFMGSCVDMTLLCFKKLKESWVPIDKINLWCELLVLEAGWIPTMHFFIKDMSVQPERIIDFVRDGRIDIYNWEYKNPRLWIGVKSAQTLFLNGINIDENDCSETLARKMHLPIKEAYFNKYFSKLTHDNTAENYKRYLRTRRPLAIKVNGTPFSREEVESDTNNELLDALKQEANEKVLKVMNDIWAIVWRVFWYPNWEVVKVERGLKSKTDPYLEERTKELFVNGTHQYLEEKYGVQDWIHMIYITLKSGIVIPLSYTIESQVWTRYSWEALEKYVERQSYDDPEISAEFHRLRNELETITFSK